MVADLFQPSRNYRKGDFQLITRFRLILMVCALALVLVPAALAARGGGSGATTCLSPTLSGPTQARVGDSYTVSGCGFAPGTLVPLEITEASGCCMALNKVADANGALSHTGNVSAAGTYRVRALSRGKNGRWRVASSWSFQAS
jgi:hypothetical protein